jgi:hypothetical protein
LAQASSRRAVAARGPAAGVPLRALAAALAAVLLAGACAPERDDDLFGLTLEVRSEQEWASDPELRRRVHALIEESCAHIGLDPDLLYGMTLRIEDGAIDCGAVQGARGCTWRDDGVIAISTLAWSTYAPRVPCVEDTPIPHELLHVKIADARHEDPRWESWEFWTPLRERVMHPECSGYAATSVW